MRVSQCRRTVRSEGRREGALGCGRAQEGNIHSEELWVLVVEPKKLQIHSATKYSYFQNDKFSLLRPLTPHLSPVPHSIHSLIPPPPPDTTPLVSLLCPQNHQHLREGEEASTLLWAVSGQVPHQLLYLHLQFSK